MSPGNSQRLIAGPFLSGLTGQSGNYPVRQFRRSRSNVNSCNPALPSQAFLISRKSARFFARQGLQHSWVSRWLAGCQVGEYGLDGYTKEKRPKDCKPRLVSNYKVRTLTAVGPDICCAFTKARHRFAIPGRAAGYCQHPKALRKFYSSGTAGIVFAVSF